MSVEVAQEVVSPEEFLQWKARFILQPRGPRDVEARWAGLMSLLHQANFTNPVPADRYVVSQAIRKKIALAAAGDFDEDDDESDE